MVTKKEKHPIQHQVGNSWQGFSIHPCHRNVQIVSPRKVSHNVQQMGSNIEPKIRIFFTLLPQGSFIAIQVKNFFKPKQIYKNTFKMYTLHTRSFLATIVNKISKTKQIYKHTSTIYTGSSAARNVNKIYNSFHIYKHIYIFNLTIQLQKSFNLYLFPFSILNCI